MLFLVRCIQAVKVISKLGIGGRSFLNLQDEIALHQRACAEGHPGILPLHNVIDFHNTLYLVSSFAPSGDLFERIVNPLRPRLCTQPETVRSIIIQLIEAVAYLHNEKGIAHRDIKPENLFWQENIDENEPYDGIERGRLLIGDFGLATEDRFAADFGSGTSFYTSPEAAGYFRRLGLGNGGGGLLSPIHLMTDAKGALSIPSPAEPGKTFEWENRLSYDTFASDIWSIGIVLINLICERNPWQCALAIDDTFKAYAADPENTLLAVLPSLSDESHELLKKVLKVNPRDRITLQEFKQDMMKIKHFVRHSEEEDYSIEEVSDRQNSWLDVGPRESTPGSSSAVSQGPSMGSTTGWLTLDGSNSDSNRSNRRDASTPVSSNNSASNQSASPADGHAGAVGATSAKPKRPQPVPLQIDPYRLSAALSGHVSASIASARFAAFARPGMAIPCPVQMPVTAPIIRLTSAQAMQKQEEHEKRKREETQDTINQNNVVKLKMPPSPAAMRARQRQSQEDLKSKEQDMSEDERKQEKKEELPKLDIPSSLDVPSPGVSSLVASVPCQLSLSGSTDASSEECVVTPIDQTGPYVAFKGEAERSPVKKRSQRDEDDDDEDGEAQWLTIKPLGQHRGHHGYLGQDHTTSSGYPPVTPTGELNGKPPLTPLLLTPTSGRRYHPYGGNPYSGQAAIINSPLRMAQQAFLDRHYGQYGVERDGYLGPAMSNVHHYAGGPRRGSVPDGVGAGISHSRGAR